MNVSHLFGPFFAEARRVLRPGGVALCKISDIVFNARYQWQHLDLKTAAEAAGMTACDMLILCNPSAGTLVSSKWKTAYHFRKSHCFWLVVRNGKRCHR